MSKVWANHFYELNAAVEQLNKSRTVHDRLAAQHRLHHVAQTVVRDRAAVAELVKTLDALPVKSKATKRDLTEYKQLQQRLERMAHERDEANKLVAQLQHELREERAAHKATKVTMNRELTEVNRRVLALQTHILELEQLKQRAGAVLLQRNPRAAQSLARQDASREAARAALHKSEGAAARLRRAVESVAQPLWTMATGAVNTAAAAAAAAVGSLQSVTAKPPPHKPAGTARFGRRILLHTRIGSHTFQGPAHAAAEQFAAVLQKQLFLGGECVEWLTGPGAPLFLHSQTAKYLRAVTCTTDTRAVLQHVRHFSALALTCVAVLQMRVYHLAAAHAAVQLGAPNDSEQQQQQQQQQNTLATVGDNLAAGRELQALCHDLVSGAAGRSAAENYFQHEVRVANDMTVLLQQQLMAASNAQAAIVRLVAAADPEAGRTLALEFLSEEQLFSQQGVSPAQLHKMTQLDHEDLRPLFDCIAVIEGYQYQRVPGEVRQRPVRPRVHDAAAAAAPTSTSARKVSAKAATAAVSLAQKMLGEISARRPAWTHLPAGLQVLMARVTLDDFAQGETQLLHVVSHRECVDYRMSEMLAAAATPEQVAGMLLRVSAVVGSKPFNIVDYVQSVEDSTTQPVDTLFPWSAAELRRIVKSGNLAPLAEYQPDWLLVDALHANQLTGGQPYLAALNAHERVCDAVAHSSMHVRDVAVALAMYAPVVAPPPASAHGLQLTQITARHTAMARAAQLVKQLIEHDSLEMPLVDVGKAQRVAHMLAVYDPAVLAKVLEHTPSVNTLISEFDPSKPPSSVGEQAAAYLRAHPDVTLQAHTVDDIVWFRPKECLSQGVCDDPATVLRANLDAARQALQALCTGYDVIATRQANRFPGTRSLLQALTHFLKLLMSPVGDSLRLQMAVTEQRHQERLAAQQAEVQKLHSVLKTLRAEHSEVSKQLREAVQRAATLQQAHTDAQARLTGAAQIVAASASQLDAIRKHLSSTEASAQAADAQAQAAAAETRHKAVLQMLNEAQSTLTPEARRELEEQAAQYAREAEELRRRTDDERAELRKVQDTLAAQIRALQVKANVLTNDVALASAQAANAQSEVAALQQAREALARQMAAAEQHVLEQVGTRMSIVAESANLTSAEECARLAEQVRAMQAKMDTMTAQDHDMQAKLAALTAERERLVTELAAARDAQATAASRVHAEQEQQIRDLQAQLHKSAARLNAVRADATATATRVVSQLSQISQATAAATQAARDEQQMQTGSSIVRAVATGLKHELDQMNHAFSNSSLHGTDALLQRVADATALTNTVINANMANERDLQAQTANLGAALKLFGEVTAMVMALRVDDINEQVLAARAEAERREADHLAAKTALDTEISELQAKLGQSVKVTQQYDALRQALSQQVADDTALAAELEAQYLALEQEGQTAAAHLAQLRQSTNNKRHKQQLAVVLAAYQARHRAVLETIEDQMHARYMRAVDNYLALLPASPAADALAAYLKSYPIQQPPQQQQQQQQASLTDLIQSNAPFLQIINQAEAELVRPQPSETTGPSHEAITLVLLQASWQRQAAQRQAAVLDVDMFMQTMMQMLEAVVAEQAAAQKHTVETLQRQLTSMVTDDMPRLQTQLADLEQQIANVDSLRDAWSDVTALQQQADAAAAQLRTHNNQPNTEQPGEAAAAADAAHDLAKRVREKRVAAAARAAAVGGAVAEAFALSTRISDLQQTALERQRLSAQLDTVVREHSVTEAELGKVRALLAQRDADHAAEVARLNDTHAQAMQAQEDAARVVQGQLDGVTAALRASEASTAFVNARDATLAVQALRTEHMRQLAADDAPSAAADAAGSSPKTVAAAHAVYVQRANVDDAISLHVHAQRLLSTLPQFAELMSASQAMMAWLDQVRAQDAAIAQRLQTNTAQSAQADQAPGAYLNVLLGPEIARTYTVQDMQLPLTEIVLDRSHKHAEVLAEQLARAHSTIRAYQSSLASQQQLMSETAVKHEAVASDMAARLAQLNAALKDAEQNATMYEVLADTAVRQQQELRTQLTASEYANSEAAQALAKATAEVGVLRQLQSANDALRAELDREQKMVETLTARLATANQAAQAATDELVQVRVQLRALELKSDSSADAMQQLRAREQALQQKIDALERRTDAGRQLVHVQNQLQDARAQAAASEAHAQQRFDAQMAELAQHDAPDISAHLAKMQSMMASEMEAFDKSLADSNASAAEMQAQRRALYAKLAQDAEAQLTEQAQKLEEKSAESMQMLIERHEREMDQLRERNALQEEELQAQMQALAEIADLLTVDTTTAAADTDSMPVRAVAAVRALQQQFGAAQDTVRTYESKLAEYAQRLADTEAALDAARAATARVEKAGVEQSASMSRQLDEALQTTRQQLQSAREDVRERDKTIQSQQAQLRQHQEQIRQLQQTLAQRDEEYASYNDELVQNIRRLDAEKQALQQQMDQLTASTDEKVQLLTEQLLQAQSDNEVLRRQLTEALEQNVLLQQQVDQAQTCDAETRAHLERLLGNAFGTHVYAHLLDVSVGDKNVCWLLKNFLLLDREDIFNREWPTFNRTQQDFSRYLWVGLARIFASRGSVEQQNGIAQCSDFTTPIDCLKHSNQCIFDDGVCKPMMATLN